MTLLNSPVERRRFIRFALVGISGAVVDFSVFNILASVIGVPSAISQAISFTLAVINNFIWNRLWTYPETRNISPVKQLVQFGLVNVIGLGIRTLLFSIIEKHLINLAALWVPNFLTPTVIGHNLTLAFVILVVMLWNYFANRYWTFKEVSSVQEKPL
jgi:putative flippase GtrA